MLDMLRFKGKIGGINIEIKFEVTEEDYIKFNLYHVENSPAHKKSYNLLRYVLPLLCSVPIYTIGTTIFKQPEIYWIIIAVLFVVVCIITYPKKYKKMIIKETKKVLKEGDNSSIFGKKTMLIDDNKIKVFNEDSSETVLRESIKAVKVYEDMILIYLSGFTAHIIPIRYLNEETKKFLVEELKVK